MSKILQKAVCVRYPLLLAIHLVVGVCVVSAADSASPPNIVLILADDLSWRDLHCYGGRLSDTPHLDRLATQGMRFSDAYAPAPICSASRSAILTGRSPARLHFEFVTKPRGVRPPARKLRPPPYTLNLPLAEQTIGELFGSAGYDTGYFGKWHVAEHHRRYLGWSPTHGPCQQGFATAQEKFGSHPYAGGKFKRGLQELPEGQLPNDAMVDAAISFLEKPRRKPFFLMVSQFYVHTPVRASTRWQYERYLERLSADAPARERRAHYGAFVNSLDHYCGQLLTALERLDLAENTLVVFTSDNGGHPEYTANAPLRGSKWNLYEAGIRVPLIVRWPRHVAAGSTSSVPAIGTDLLPTLCAAAEVKLPKLSLDGCSLLGILRGEARQPEPRALSWHFPYYHPERGYDQALEQIGMNDFAVSQTRPQSAIRMGGEKLLYFYEGDRKELYNLRTDIGEQNDLAATHPARAAKLVSRLQKQLKAMGARLPVAVK